MVDDNTLAAVMRHAQRWLPTVSSADSDLVLLSMGDPTRVGRVLEGLYKDFNLNWPMIPDADGKLQAAQLYIGESLTVRELSEIVKSGGWPQSWTRPGMVLRTP